MKKLYWICCAATLICILALTTLVLLLPNTIPVHFNIAGEADRFGSKYEYLVFPILVATISGLCLGAGCYYNKKNDKKTAKFILITHIVSFALMVGVSLYFILKVM